MAEPVLAPNAEHPKHLRICAAWEALKEREVDAAEEVAAKRLAETDSSDEEIFAFMRRAAPTHDSLVQVATTLLPEVQEAATRDRATNLPTFEIDSRQHEGAMAEIESRMTYDQQQRWPLILRLIRDQRRDRAPRPALNDIQLLWQLPDHEFAVACKQIRHTGHISTSGGRVEEGAA